MSATQTYNKLVPEPTPHSAPYWEGLNERKLLLQKCRSCGRIRHYPQPMCPVCHSMEVEWIEASGRGAVHSWTVTHHPFHPGFRDDLPYTLATVDLAEGVRMATNLIDIAPDPELLKLGMPLTVKFEERGDQFLPVFAPVEGGTR